MSAQPLHIIGNFISTRALNGVEVRGQGGLAGEKMDQGRDNENPMGEGLVFCSFAGAAA